LGAAAGFARGADTGFSAAAAFGATALAAFAVLLSTTATVDAFFTVLAAVAVLAALARLGGDAFSVMIIFLGLGIQ
jgi:hypothetical protein